VILLINGAFGIGKTTVARLLVKRLPRAIVFDPELIGIPLQRITGVDDFQDLRLWRWLTVAALRIARLFFGNVVVPMAISDPAYLIRGRDVVHVCLVAPVEVVYERLAKRGRDAGEWERRRAEECCVAHQRPEFARQVNAEGTPEEIANAILRAIH
jgi:broad-specificity NMP kinase